ncbi:hypothetical protein [Acidisoma sp. 7E03]
MSSLEGRKGARRLLPLAHRKVLRQGVRIDIACNDPNNGQFVGRANMFALPDGLGEFEARNFLHGPKLTELKDAIRIRRQVFPVKGSREWIGNWCWNGYWMEPPIAAEFVLTMWRSRKFSCSSETEAFGRFLFEDWEAGEPIAAAELEAALIQAQAATLPRHG